jgi:protein-tyrosine phosphatase
MPGYVDIHAHILPGIDDGPEDLAGSLVMARAAAESGITTLVATPHLRTDFPHVNVGELAKCSQALQEAIDRERIPLRIVPGAEVSLVWALEASDEELKLASCGQRGADLLIEAPSLDVAGLDSLLYGLRAKGNRVTLAHPERCPEFQREPRQLAELARQGVLLQLNADSLLGDPRRSSVAWLAQRLCANGLAHVLASDGHRGASWRPVTTLAQAVPAVTVLVGAERVRWMVQTAPAAIVEGAKLLEPPAIVRQRWSRRLFGLP